MSISTTEKDQEPCLIFDNWWSEVGANYDESTHDSCFMAFECAWDFQQSKINKLEQVNAIYKEACEFYGGKQSWIVSNNKDRRDDLVGSFNEVRIDCGDKAREALRRAGEIDK